MPRTRKRSKATPSKKEVVDEASTTETPVTEEIRDENVDSQSQGAEVQQPEESQGKDKLTMDVEMIDSRTGNEPASQDAEMKPEADGNSKEMVDDYPKEKADGNPEEKPDKDMSKDQKLDSDDKKKIGEEKKQVKEKEKEIFYKPHIIPRFCHKSLTGNILNDTLCKIYLVCQNV